MPASIGNPVERLKGWLLPLALYLAITVQSSFRLPLRVVYLSFQDKLMHFLLYALLAFFVARALRRFSPNFTTPLIFAVTASLVSILGAVDELHQTFVPGRSAEALDILADGLGAVCGAAAHGLLLKRVRKGGGPRWMV